jgi:hypothetical protein
MMWCVIWCGKEPEEEEAGGGGEGMMRSECEREGVGLEGREKGRALGKTPEGFTAKFASESGSAPPPRPPKKRQLPPSSSCTACPIDRSNVPNQARHSKSDAPRIDHFAPLFAFAFARHHWHQNAPTTRQGAAHRMLGQAVTAAGFALLLHTTFAVSRC